MKLRTKNIFLVLSSAMLLTGCIAKQGGSFRMVKYFLENNEAFTITTNLQETKEIHTEQQAEYLAYEGEYVTIPEANYPDGQKHLSDPNPVNLAWEFAVPSDKTLTRYNVVVGKQPDLSDGYALQGTTATNLDVYNSYLGDNYFKVVAVYSDGTSDSSPINKYTVDEVYPRNLKIDGMTNCRDMGGARVLEDGGTIRQGLLYRTSSTNQWAYGRGAVPDTITTAGKEELLSRLGCKTEINVNNSGSSVAGIDKYVEAYMYYDGGKHHLYRNAEPLKEVFHTLADPNNYPIFYHCRIGTDRTGLCAIMISGLLGVSENEIYQDYLFSNFGNIQEKRYIGEKAGRDNILNYINDIKAFPGEKFQNKVYNYLLSIGVPAEELNSIIDILVEGDKPAGNDYYQEVITPDRFYSDDLEIKTNENDRTKRANPKEYFTLEADKQINMEFEAAYDGEAKLVAYLGSTDSSATKKIADSIEVEYDYDTLEIDDLSFADVGFGQGDGRTYYSAVVLGTVQVTKGNQEIFITGLANNLNIGAVSIIPFGEVKADVPEEQPSSSSSAPVASSSEAPAQVSSSAPTQPAASSESNSSSQKTSSSSRGCGGSIVASSGIIALIAMSGVAILMAKKRKE